jgi:hypothetical protein
MYLQKIRKITIFGGGTSGWLTAAYLVNNLAVPTEIVLIEDSEKGPIGVGEGTQPFTAKFLSQCGIPPHMWMKDSNASFKYGVELTGWNDEPYFVDNDNQDNAVIAHDFYTSDYFIDKPYAEFAKWHPAYRLAKKNVCQKFDDYLDVNHRMGPMDFGAVHFGAYDIIKTIKSLILDKITYVDTNIIKITVSSDGIDSLVSDGGSVYKSDLFIDCSGFSSLLLEQNLKVPFVDYTRWLPNDSAVVIRTQFTNPQEQCHPYTKATAMNSGWMFTIPTYKSIGNGYVYSSKFITPEDAEQELRTTIGEHVSPARHLKMKCGYHKEIAVKNVCAVGLSAGFVEPLEATGITFTTSVVSDLVGVLNNGKNVWGEQQKAAINRNFNFMSHEILAFVWAHYYFSTKNDTEYWKSFRTQDINHLPQMSKEILELFLPVPKRFLNIAPNSMFNVVQWFTVLHAGGAYNGIQTSLTEKQQKYAEYFLECHSKRLELAESMFDNHYDYLTDWYSQ